MAGLMNKCYFLFVDSLALSIPLPHFDTMSRAFCRTLKDAVASNNVLLACRNLKQNQTHIKQHICLDFIWVEKKTKFKRSLKEYNRNKVSVGYFCLTVLSSWKSAKFFFKYKLNTIKQHVGFQLVEIKVLWVAARLKNSNYLNLIQNPTPESSMDGQSTTGFN